MVHLLSGRAARFRLERLAEVVDRIVALDPDHVLITGDLTTTALPAEFAEARRALSSLLPDAIRATVLPGNHDRYTRLETRTRQFEAVFGEFAPEADYPWLKPLDGETAILGLDPTRPHWSARGKLPDRQLRKARDLVRERPKRLIVACHYPLTAPEGHREELRGKRLENAPVAAEWLAGIGKHIYCCGHVHASWAFTPTEIPNQLALNSGAPLLRDREGGRPPGFLLITLEDSNVRVVHHGWKDNTWIERELANRPQFFEPEPI